jgi:hypothetical protein
MRETDNLNDLVRWIRTWERREAYYTLKVQQARHALYALRARARALPSQSRP